MIQRPLVSHFLQLVAAASSSGSESDSPSPPIQPRKSRPFTIDAILGLSQPPTPAALDYSRTTGDKQVVVSESKKNGKSKRVRTIFTPEQLERLEAEFERQQYMVGPERLYLAHALQLTEAQVKVWFQNRRIKWRKQHLELQQQRLAAMKHHHHQQQRTGTPLPLAHHVGHPLPSAPQPQQLSARQATKDLNGESEADSNSVDENNSSHFMAAASKSLE